MKVIISVTRTFKDYKLLSDYCSYCLSNQNDIEIVGGTVKGAAVENATKELDVVKSMNIFQFLKWKNK